jgi:hypothetical protein
MLPYRVEMSDVGLMAGIRRPRRGWSLPIQRRRSGAGRVLRS